MQTRRTILFLFVLSCGCGGGDGGDGDGDADSDTDTSGGPPIAGLYEVTHHTESVLLDVDCTTEGNERTEPPYFQVLESSSASGGAVFGFHPCTSADAASCDGMDSLGFVDTPETEGWSSTLPYSHESADSCELSLLSDRVFVSTDESIRLEGRRYGETVSLADGPCTADEAASRGTDMPCERYEVIEGRPLQ